ncbi:MAG: TetR/AcrR family transcriptional regulator, partial [Lactococcus garvieae]
MIKKTFYNLPEEKRQRIISAIMQEFASSSTEKVSINRIIKAANISRGSFYQYFEDKSDLLDYILSNWKDRLQTCFKRNLEKYNGKLFEMTEAI